MNWKYQIFFVVCVIVFADCQQEATNDFQIATHNNKLGNRTVTSSSVMPNSSYISLITSHPISTEVMTSTVIPTSSIISNGSSIVVSNTTVASSMILPTPVSASNVFNSTMVHNATVSSSHLTVTSILPSSASTHNIMSSSIVHTTTPEPARVIIECGDECKSLKNRMYAATVFAVLFVIVAITLGILLYRQCKISRDRDDQMSRLI